MQWLKGKRLNHSLTQKEIADSIGISDGFYSMIENGSRRPSPKVAKRIAEVLGFPNEWYKLLEESNQNECEAAANASIKQKREANAFSIDDMALLLGISSTEYIAIEDGREPLTAELAEALEMI